jgi:hypothetical protein
MFIAFYTDIASSRAANVSIAGMCSIGRRRTSSNKQQGLEFVVNTGPNHPSWPQIVRQMSWLITSLISDLLESLESARTINSTVVVCDKGFDDGTGNGALCTVQQMEPANVVCFVENSKKEERNGSLALLLSMR